MFTKTGWANMKKKYGTEVKPGPPVYTKTGLKEFVNWGENIKFNSVSEAPIYTKSFWNEAGFKIDREKVKEKITVMETNEEGEEVEVTKEVLVDPPPLPLWFTKGGLGINEELQSETFYKQLFDEETGAPVWTATGLGGSKNKAIVRLNNGDVRVVDKDNIPDECKDPEGIPGYM